MGFQLHETVYGKNFVGNQLPELIRAIERVADAIENRNDGLCIRTCRSDYCVGDRQVLRREMKYIVKPEGNDTYTVYAVEDGEKILCQKSEIEKYLE